MKVELKNDDLNNEIINKWSFLGLNLYQRIRTYENQIIVSKDRRDDFYLGLYPITKYPKLEYDYITLFQKKDWSQIADLLIYKSIFHLIFNDTIRVFEFQDDKKILFGTFTINKDGYYLKVNKRSFVEDLFLSQIIDSIDEVEVNYKRRSDIQMIIKCLLDGFLGNEEHNNPEKKFITRLLKRYTKEYSWIELITEKIVFGLSKKYKVKISDKKLNELNAHFRILNETTIKQQKNFSKLAFFSSHLSSVVENEFKRRYPKSDNS